MPAGDCSLEVPAEPALFLLPVLAGLPVFVCIVRIIYVNDRTSVTLQRTMAWGQILLLN